MRHQRVINHLGRTSSHRKAMLANMATSLILHKRITTTIAKAKALRTYVEPLITKSKDDSTHSRRVVFSYLQNKEAVTELFREVSPKVADRPGGYTRILKTGNRLGDNADMCFIELVDFNEAMLEAAEGKAKATRRRRPAKKKSDTEAIAAAPAKEATPVADVVKEEVVEETATEVSGETETEVTDTAEETGEAETTEEETK